MSYPVSCPVHGQRLFLRIFLRVGASDNSHLSLGWALSGRCDGFQYAISELPAEWLAPLLVTAFSLPIAPGLFWGVPKYQIGLPYFRKIRRIVVNQRQAPPPTYLGWWRSSGARHLWRRELPHGEHPAKCGSGRLYLSLNLENRGI